jgi:hypothetical protein
MLHPVALVRTDVSEELNSSILRVTGLGELGITLAVTSNRCTLRRNTPPWKPQTVHCTIGSEIFGYANINYWGSIIISDLVYTSIAEQK